MSRSSLFWGHGFSVVKELYEYIRDVTADTPLLSILDLHKKFERYDKSVIEDIIRNFVNQHFILMRGFTSYGQGMHFSTLAEMVARYEQEQRDGGDPGLSQQAEATTLRNPEAALLVKLIRQLLKQDTNKTLAIRIDRIVSSEAPGVAMVNSLIKLAGEHQL